MASFKDSAGREWLVEINYWSARQVRERTGVDLGTVLQDGMKPYVALLENRVALGEVLWALLSEQAEKRGLTEEQVFRTFDGDTMERAVNAFQAAFESFCPSRPRKVMSALAAKNEELLERETAKILAKIATLTDAPPTSSPSASSSPESSASVPAG